MYFISVCCLGNLQIFSFQSNLSCLLCIEASVSIENLSTRQRKLHFFFHVNELSANNKVDGFSPFYDVMSMFFKKELKFWCVSALNCLKLSHNLASLHDKVWFCILGWHDLLCAQTQFSGPMFNTGLTELMIQPFTPAVNLEAPLNSTYMSLYSWKKCEYLKRKTCKTSI